MKRCTIPILAFIGIIFFCADLFGQVMDKDLISALQTGGYVIYLRHPKTDPNQADTDPLNLDNIKAQRHLTDEGRMQAKRLGKLFEY
jgi:hypothetical protein